MTAIPRPRTFGQEQLVAWTAGTPSIDLLALMAGLSFFSISLTDAHHRLLYLDELTAERFGLDPQELLGRKVTDLVPPEMRAEREHIRERINQCNGGWFLAVDMFYGTQVWHLSRTLDLEGEKGQLTLTVTPPVSADLPTWMPHMFLEHVSDPGHLAPLTLGELEVLRLLAMNASQEEIASELNRSIKAIERRRTLLGRKLGAANRSELAVIGAEAGLHRLSPEQIERLAVASFGRSREESSGIG